MNDKITMLAHQGHEPKDYQESISDDGFVSYGADNLFPQHLLSLFHESPTHSALIQSIAQMIYGDGFDATDLDGRILVDKWNLNDELRKCSIDFKIQGGYALEILWSQDRTTISNVSHLPFECLRACEVDENDVVTHYKYSVDWADDGCEVMEIPAFNPESAGTAPRQVMYVSPFSAGSFYYPKPDYIGALNYVELEREIGEYHINNIQNGLSPSFSIHFKNGVPSPEERNQIRRDIESQMTGSKGAGKVWITYSDLPEQKPDFEPIPLSDADKQYQFLSEECTAKIMVGHRVTNPQLFGVLVAGKLGGGSELDTSSDIFERNVISGYRNVIIESVNTLFQTMGLKSRLVSVGVAEEANVSQSYTGIQISSAVDVIAKVGTGELNTKQAIQILVSMLGFNREQAEQMFSVSTNLSSDESLLELADELIAVGEDLDDEWELIDAREVNYDLENVLDAMWTFARVPSSNPSGKSEQDSDIIKVRYVYAPNQTTNDSRKFCSLMVNAGKVYRKEDILAASARAVNPGFGFQGASTYDIWQFKGGPRCHHFWERRTYLRKDNKRISVNEAKAIINKLPVKDRENRRLPVNNPNVAKLPNDMPHKGFHPDNPNKPSDAL